MSRPPRRLIISSDAANEADDQFAIVHALLTSTLDVRTIVPAHFGRPGSRDESRAEIDLLLDLMHTTADVLDGSAVALPDEGTPMPSAGSLAIAREALSGDDRLYVAVLGPLTDVASALLQYPEIAERDVVVVWVGGPPYEGVAAYHPEFNLINDVHAANVVMESGLAVWQIPMSVYTMIGVGGAELRARLAGTSPLADLLIERVASVNAAADYGPLDFRSLGDSPAIGAVMNAAGLRWTERAAPRFSLSGGLVPGRADRLIRVCDAVDTRWLVEDMFAKLIAFASDAGSETDSHSASAD